MAAPILGDLLFRAVSFWTRLAGNTTATRKFLRQVGTGAASAAPAWDTLVAGDLPSTAVTPGSYTSTDLTVDQQGRITAAANGTPGGGGTVTHTGTLTAGKAIIGNGGVDVTVSAASGVAHLASGAMTGSNILESEITLADNTTNNVSTSAHGLFPKLPSGVPGVLLGYTSYSPGSDTPFTTTSATLADVDATNLKVTFTVPVSGNVLVRLCAYCNSGGAGLDYWWSIRDGSSDIVGAGGAAIATASNLTVTMAFVITGLVAGTATTWKWSHARQTSGTGRMFAGPGGTNTPPAVMEVWAA